MANKKASIAVDQTVLDDYKAKQIELVDLLQSAPVIISLLGRLCLLSFTVLDIELLPTIEITQIRAGLQQVVTAGSDALCFAEEKLREIGPLTVLLSKGILDMVTLTLKGTPAQVAQNLPELLCYVTKRAGVCVDVAQKVEQRFEVMIQLLIELMEHITASRSGLDNEVVLKHESVAKKEGLMEGLMTLSKLTQQWQRLVEFFNFLVSIIDTEISGPVKELMKGIAETNDKKEKGKLSDYVQKNLQVRVNKLATAGAQVNLVTKLYLDTLQNFVGDRITTLDSLLTITDAVEREAKENDMARKCELLIVEIGKQKDARIASAENDFKKILGITDKRI